MFFGKQLAPITLAMGAALTLSGCTDIQDNDKPTVQSDSPLTAFNGQSWNGQSWNGQSWNGQSWNGQSWNGQSWNGLGWNGQSWNGIGWNGQSWNGQSWNGQSWNGQSWNGQSWNGVAGQDAPIFTALHNWVNHSDVNGNNTPNPSIVNQCGPSGTYSSSYLNDADDLAQRLSAIGAWVSCACPSGTSIPFSDTHGRGSVVFSGGLGLAPTWCGGDMSATVPESELQIVSACLISRINMKGKHYPLSLRSLEVGTALSQNEKFISNRPLAMYWGNLWKTAHKDFDSTNCAYDPSSATYPCNQLLGSGGSWWNLERFSLAMADPFLPGGNAGQMSDQVPFGRDCEIGTCQDHVEYLGTVYQQEAKQLGNLGAWDPADSKTLYYKGVAPTGADKDPLGGVDWQTAPSQGGGTTTKTASYRGNSWRVMEVYGPRSITFENPESSFPGWSRLGWAQLEAGSLPSSTSVFTSTWVPQVASCDGGLNECEGKPGKSPGKLRGLYQQQTVTLNMSANGPQYDPYNNANYFYNWSGDPNEPVALAIRYSWSGAARNVQLLGDGQCDVDNGCPQTRWNQCQSGSVTTNGCLGGTSTPGQLNIFVNHNRPYGYVPDSVNVKNGVVQNPNRSEWAQVHGTNSPYGKNMFPSTYAGNQYSTAYIYPIYLQDSVKQIPGAVDNTSGVTYDTVRVKLTGATVNATDAPDLDTAYFFPGMPPGDANCQAGNGCFLYAGPNLTLSMSSGGSWSYTWPAAPAVNGTPSGDPSMAYYWYTSPTLPPGTYTYQLANMTNGDLDLYVKANAQVSMSSYDCRPYYGTNSPESCSITLTAPGYISVMVHGYSSTIGTATFIGHN